MPLRYPSNFHHTLFMILWIRKNLEEMYQTIKKRKVCGYFLWHSCFLCQVKVFWEKKSPLKKNLILISQFEFGFCICWRNPSFEALRLFKGRLFSFSNFFILHCWLFFLSVSKALVFQASARSPYLYSYYLLFTWMYWLVASCFSASRGVLFIVYTNLFMKPNIHEIFKKELLMKCGFLDDQNSGQ